MTSAVLDKKPSAQKTLDMVAGKPLPCSEATCQPCHRVDLSLLIVVPGVVPKKHARTLIEAGYIWNTAFDAEFGAVKREATVPVARIAREGYVYLYYESRKRWDVWQVMANGLTRQIVYQANEQQCAKRLSAFIGAAAPKACGQGAKNHAAHTICVEGAHTLDKVWFAYSPELWPLKVLERYAANPEVEVPGPDGKPAKRKLRTLRGRELPLKRMTQSGAAGIPGCLPLNEQTLANHVADFANCADRKYVQAFDDSLRPLDEDRIGQARAFAERMRALEKAAGTPAKPDLYLNKSAVVMLSDDIGVAEEHNQLRLLAWDASQAWAAGGPDQDDANDDPLRAWKLRSALHVEMIEDWVFSRELAIQKAIDSGGGYKHSMVISGDEYRRRMAHEKATGKPYDAGASYQKLGGPVEKYRVTWTQQKIDKGLEGIAHRNAQDRIERYRGKLRYDALTTFRAAFKAGMDAWDRYITALDTDYVTWLHQNRLAAMACYDFDDGIDLAKLDPARGTAAAQVEGWLARVRAQDRIWGGGAVTVVSARELAAAYDKNPNAPAKWIDSALLKPFTAEGVVKDAVEQKETAEKLNGLVRELPKEVKHLIHLRHEAHGSHVAGLTHVSQQAAALHASLVEVDHAKALGVAAVTAAEAKQTMNIAVRTSALMEMMTNPSADRYVTIAVKVPLGEAMDKMSDAFSAGQLDMKIESRSETTRKVRRKGASRMRRLARQPGLTQPEFQTVAVTEKTLAKLEAEAAKSGGELVEVIAVDPLGKKLPSGFKLPKSTALNLIGDQASAAAALRRTVVSPGGIVTSLIGVLQGRALWDVLGKLDKTEGRAHADLMFTTFNCITGLAETGATLRANYFGLQAGGGKLTLARMSVSAAKWRLVAGAAGAAGMLLTALSMYAKYQSAKERGSWEAMEGYKKSAGLFGMSFTALGTSSLLRFAINTTTKYAVSRAAVSVLSAGTAEMLGASLTGVGVVLAAVGFAVYLYALSLEDDLNEIFLKRGYWGRNSKSLFYSPDDEAGSSALLPYGIANRPAKARGELNTNLDTRPDLHKGSDAEAFQRWADLGFEDEVRGFHALSVGVKSTLTWADKDWVVATVEAMEGSEKSSVSYALVLQEADGKAVLEARNKDAELEFEAETQRYSFKHKLPTELFWDKIAWASFDYKLYGEDKYVPVAEDTLQLKKPA